VKGAELTLYDVLAEELSRDAGVVTRRRPSLRQLTRFGIGGEAALLVDVSTEGSLVAVLERIHEYGAPHTVIGGGTNLVVADAGFDGVVVRYCGGALTGIDGGVRAEAGAELQSLVDYTIDHGLAGMHTMTRIPGWVGAAIYGNAGAYGHSIHEFVSEVRYFDGAEIRTLDKQGCGFVYRGSIFKRDKSWVILSVDLQLPRGDPAILRAEAEKIRAIRDEKYPPTMRCAGSIFKNLLMADLPEEIAARVPGQVVREGKVASAWFLEQTGVKGMRRGDIQVAHYHANLVYNDGAGMAEDLRAVIEEMKARVRMEFGLVLEEEVQFIGF